VQYN
jgi:hypothetical protein